jgi:hypothetical protein
VIQLHGWWLIEGGLTTTRFHLLNEILPSILLAVVCHVATIRIVHFEVICRSDGRKLQERMHTNVCLEVMMKPPTSQAAVLISGWRCFWGDYVICMSQTDILLVSHKVSGGLVRLWNVGLDCDGTVVEQSRDDISRLLYIKQKVSNMAFSVCQLCVKMPFKFSDDWTGLVSCKLFPSGNANHKTIHYWIVVVNSQNLCGSWKLWQHFWIFFGCKVASTTLVR